MAKRRHGVQHPENEHGQREHGADPETACHVAQFVVVGRLGRGGFRFERHAANRATAWMVLLDLRVHRAGVDRLTRNGRDPCRISFERHAALRTIAGLVADDAFAHRAVVFRRGWRLHVLAMRVMVVLLLVARSGGQVVMVVHVIADGAASKSLHFAHGVTTAEHGSASLHRRVRGRTIF